MDKKISGYEAHSTGGHGKWPIAVSEVYEDGDTKVIARFSSTEDAGAFVFYKELGLIELEVENEQLD
jgi:hypothetical protein